MRKGAFTRRWFKPVPGFNGYWINGKGRLYSEKSGKFLKFETQVNIKGYPRVELRNGHGPEKKFIHRLVAMVFCDNPNPKTRDQVNHKDWNITNFYYKNLEWVTAPRYIA